MKGINKCSFFDSSISLAIYNRYVSIVLNDFLPLYYHNTFVITDIPDWTNKLQ